MTEVLVSNFEQRVKEILPGAKSYPSFGYYIFQLKTDNKDFRIYYSFSPITQYVTVYAYYFVESKPSRHAVARNYGSSSYYRITVGKWTDVKAEFELKIDEVPGIFTDESMFPFIADVRDNGIRAFADFMESLASRHGQSFTIRV